MNKETLVCQKGMKLSEQLKRARTDRPDEWTMDRYIAKATEMEEALDKIEKARKAAILVERYANQRVIEELEMILDRTKLAVNIDSIRKHITSQIKLKR
jgi:prophage DNA circulation protein